MARRIDLNNASQRITAATIDSSCTPRDRHLNKYTGVTTNNAWDDIVNGDSTPGDTALVLVINANTSSSSREGYGEIMYNIDGTECSKILHLVQAGSGGDFKLTVNVPSGKTSPAFKFLDRNGNVLFSHIRVNGGIVGELSSWNRSGTCTQMEFVENGSYLTLVTLMNNNGVKIINSQSLNPGTTQTRIDLTQSFNTSDYTGGTKVLSLTFS